MLLLLLEDGRTAEVRPGDIVARLERLIEMYDVKTIVVGRVAEGDRPGFEKQFEAVTVMPSTFGMREG